MGCQPAARTPPWGEGCCSPLAWTWPLLEGAAGAGAPCQHVGLSRSLRINPVLQISLVIITIIRGNWSVEMTTAHIPPDVGRIHNLVILEMHIKAPHPSIPAAEKCQSHARQLCASTPGVSGSTSTTPQRRHPLFSYVSASNSISALASQPLQT